MQELHNNLSPTEEFLRIVNKSLADAVLCRHCSKPKSEHTHMNMCPLPPYPQKIRNTRFLAVSCEAVLRTFGDNFEECGKPCVPGFFQCREHLEL